MMEQNTEASMTGVTLAQEIREHMDAEKMSIQAIADKIGVSRPAISQYLDGKYQGDNQKLAEKLAAFLEDTTGVPHVARIRGQLVGVQSRGFFGTMDAGKIALMCKRAQEDRLLSIVCGKAGFGKTYALKLYSKRDKVIYICCGTSMGCRDLVNQIGAEIVNYSLTGSVWERIKVITKFFHDNPGYLLIVDEADKLINKNTLKKLEILRDIYDRASTGMVLAGESELAGMISSYDERMANRVDEWGLMRGISEKEFQAYMSQYTATADALEELKKRAFGGERSSFRLFDRTLKNCFRIMNERGETEISLKTVREASAGMLL